MQISVYSCLLSGVFFISLQPSLPLSPSACGVGNVFLPDCDTRYRNNREANPSSTDLVTQPFFLFYMDPTPCGQLRARPHCFCVSFTDDTPDCLALVFGSPAIAWGYVFLIATFSQQAHTRHSMLACNAKSDHCCWEPTSLCCCLDAQYHLTEQNTGCGNEKMRETRK